MKHTRSLLPLSFAALASASPYPTVGKIHWGPCNQTIVNTTFPHDCADFQVPLDWTNPKSNGTVTLNLARIKAIKQPSKGSVLTNFGGPGEDGRATLAGLASTLLALSGGEYDILSFDPRGTVETLPFNCYTSPLQIGMWMDETKWWDASDDALTRLWARAEVDAQSCHDNNAEIGSYIGTAFTARDMLAVAQSVDNADGLIRYWGFSYGTTLGATIAAMFPDKIDKLIIDGVQNPHEYYHSFADFQEWTMSDSVFAEIWNACAKVGPEVCPMAKHAKTGPELQRLAYKVAEDLKQAPIPVKGGFLLDYTLLRGIFSFSLYTPKSWPPLVTLLDLILSKNTTSDLFDKLMQGYELTFLGNTVVTSPLYGIHCGDHDPQLRAKTFDEILPTINKLTNETKVMDGSDISPAMMCARWKFTAKERYSGNFNEKTKNPLLIIANTHDGHTPITSAKNVSAGFEGSRLLTVDGYGHTSIQVPSKCSIEKVSAYWANGTLPKQGTVCKSDAPPYSGLDWPDIIAEYYGNHSAIVQGAAKGPTSNPGMSRRWNYMGMH